MVNIQLLDPNLPSPPTGKYPARAHAKRVADAIGKSSDAKTAAASSKTYLYLQGQTTRMLEDNDQPVRFRQRRSFYYLSGCDLPDSHLVYDFKQERLTLFIPPVDPEEVIWSGLPLSAQDALSK